MLEPRGIKCGHGMLKQQGCRSLMYIGAAASCGSMSPDFRRQLLTAGDTLNT